VEESFSNGSKKAQEETLKANGNRERNHTGAWCHESFVQGISDRRIESQPIAVVSQYAVSVLTALPLAPPMLVSLSHSAP